MQEEKTKATRWTEITSLIEFDSRRVERKRIEFPTKTFLHVPAIAESPLLDKCTNFHFYFYIYLLNKDPKYKILR